MYKHALKEIKIGNVANIGVVTDNTVYVGKYSIQLVKTEYHDVTKGFMCNVTGLLGIPTPEEFDIATRYKVEKGAQIKPITDLPDYVHPDCLFTIMGVANGNIQYRTELIWPEGAKSYALSLVSIATFGAVLKNKNQRDGLRFTGQLDELAGKFYKERTGEDMPTERKLQVPVPRTRPKILTHSIAYAMRQR